MSNDRQWEYSSLVQIEKHQDGLEVAAGLPRKGVPVGPGKHVPIPDTYSVGALGWTATLVDIEEDTGPPPDYAIQRAQEVQQYEGQQVDLPKGGGKYTIPDNASAVARDKGRWDGKPKRPPRVKGAAVVPQKGRVGPL